MKETIQRFGGFLAGMITSQHWSIYRLGFEYG
jgi:hypothetical protein